MTSHARIFLPVSLLLILGLSSTAVPAADKPLIIAHYMAWFGLPDKSGQWDNWKFDMGGVDAEHHHYPDLLLPNGRHDVAAIHYPSIGPYDSTDPHLAEYHILLAKEAGIDAFMTNWYGFEDEKGQRRQEDKGFENLLRAAERLGFKVCLNYDDKASFPPFQNVRTRAEAVAHAKQTMERVLREYASSPAYLKIKGRAVVSNFASPYANGSSLDQQAFTANEWKQIFGANRNAFYFIHDHQWGWNMGLEKAGFINVADSVYCWVGRSDDREAFLKESRDLVRRGKMSMLTGVANPGFDNTPCWGWGGGISQVPRRAGQEFRDQFEQSLGYDPGLVQLVTWNDFTEGSTIEPTVEYGDLYLKITAGYANKDTAGAPYGKSFDLPKQIYDLRERADRLKESRRADAAVLDKAGQDLDGAAASCLKHDRSAALDQLKEAEGLLAGEEAHFQPMKRLDVSLMPLPAQVFAGETVDLVFQVGNPLNEIAPAYIEVDHYQIPRSWMGDLEKTLWLKPGERREVRFPIHVPSDAKDRVGWFTVTADCPYAPATSNVVYMKVLESYVRPQIGSVNLLAAGASQPLTLTVDVHQKAEEPADVALSASAGWTVKPTRQKVALPTDGRVTVPFTLTAPAKPGASGAVTLSLTYGGKTKVLKEPYAVLPANGPGLLQGDVNQDGVVDFVLGNDKVELLCTPALGGRILSLVNRATGANQLFLDYPRVQRTQGDIWQKWAEYGGANDWFPNDWPGDVWNNDWKVQLVPPTKDKAAVIFYTQTKEGLVIQREMSVDAHSAAVEVKYELKNLSKAPQTIYWSNHPDMAPGGGGASNEDLLVVPSREDNGSTSLAKKTFFPRLEKTHYRPSEGWMLAYNNARHEYVGEVFDEKKVEKLGLWEGANFFTMEVILPKTELPPRTKRSFAVRYVVGRGSLDAAVQDLRTQRSH